MFLATAAAAWWHLAHRPPVERVAAADDRAPVQMVKPHWQGVGSCSAAACHGGSEAGGIKGSEYTIWMTRDPHARAYAVLYDKRSERIVKNLHGPKATPAAKDRLCLKCHAMDAEPSARGPRFTIQDGVGCESCHGAAEKWLTRHYQADWGGLSAAAKDRLGMRPTKDLLGRAKMCVECHVGAADRDVNHDLIAAGHPRLNFEYGSFLAILPKHWDVRREKARHPDFEARVWALGQAASAGQALELLAHRAEPKSNRPWPEFAEYNCFACHHDLREPSWRQQRGFGQRLPGAFPWSTWYVSDMLPRALATQASKEAGSALSESLAAIRKEMQKGNPDRKKVMEQARAAAAQLDPLLNKLAEADGATADGLRKMIASLGEGKEPAAADWDQAVQRYLAIAALYHGMGDLNPRYRDARLKAFIRKMADDLAFPKGYDSPRDFGPRK
jgi:hypothetical protein